MLSSINYSTWLPKQLMGLSELHVSPCLGGEAHAQYSPQGDEVKFSLGSPYPPSSRIHAMSTYMTCTWGSWGCAFKAQKKEDPKRTRDLKVCQSIWKDRSNKDKSWFLGRGRGEQLFNFQSPAVHWIARTSSLNCLSCRNPYQTPHSLNRSPLFTEKPFFSLKSASSASPSQKSAPKGSCTARREQIVW